MVQKFEIAWKLRKAVSTIAFGAGRQTFLGKRNAPRWSAFICTYNDVHTITVAIKVEKTNEPEAPRKPGKSKKAEKWRTLWGIPERFIICIPLFIYPPPHGIMCFPIYGKAPAPPARLPVLRGSPPHARLPHLGSPFRGPGDTGNWTRDPGPSYMGLGIFARCWTSHEI